MDAYITRDEFDPILFGAKRSEIMSLDAEIGAVIRFREIDPDAAILTGRWVDVRVTWRRPIDRGARALVSFVPMQHGIDRPSLTPDPKQRAA